MEGTVICASRAEGLVARAGSAPRAAASGRGGMARGNAGPAALPLGGVLAAAVFGLVTGAFAAGFALADGAAFLVAGCAAFTGAFLAAVLTAAFFAGALATF